MESAVFHPTVQFYIDFRRGAICVTMYNFGSPRVGNKIFAQVYNEKVKDSWRVVNHRDVIPIVPRLIGYCHVAQPVYLAAGDPKNTVCLGAICGAGLFLQGSCP